MSRLSRNIVYNIFGQGTLVILGSSLLNLFINNLVQML